MTVATPPRTTARPADRRPRQNFETWTWLFMRVSGLALIFLALVHFTLTHIVTDVAKTNFAFVGHRWHNPLWRLFDWSLLGLALFHGLNGLRIVLIDFFPSAVRNQYSLMLGVVFLTLAVGIPGAYVIMRPFLHGHLGIG